MFEHPVIAQNIFGEARAPVAPLFLRPCSLHTVPNGAKEELFIKNENPSNFMPRLFSKMMKNNFPNSDRQQLNVQRVLVPLLKALISGFLDVGSQ